MDASEESFATSGGSSQDGTTLPGSTEDDPIVLAGWGDISYARAPIASLKGTHLEWSSIARVAAYMNGTRSFGKMGSAKKMCLFCRKEYTGGPVHIRNHLDTTLWPRERSKCSPTVEWVHRHAEVVAVLREQAEAAQCAVDLAAKKRSAKSVSSKQAGSSMAGSSNTCPSNRCDHPPSSASSSGCMLSSRMVSRCRRR